MYEPPGMTWASAEAIFCQSPQVEVLLTRHGHDPRPRGLSAGASFTPGSPQASGTKRTQSDLCAFETLCSRNHMDWSVSLQCQPPAIRIAVPQPPSLYRREVGWWGGALEVSAVPSCKGGNGLCCDVQGRLCRDPQVTCDPGWTDGLNHGTKISFLATGQLVCSSLYSQAHSRYSVNIC